MSENNIRHLRDFKGPKGFQKPVDNLQALFAEEVKNGLEAINKSQTELSNALGISKFTLSRKINQNGAKFTHKDMTAIRDLLSKWTANVVPYAYPDNEGGLINLVAMSDGQHRGEVFALPLQNTSTAAFAALVDRETLWWPMGVKLFFDAVPPSRGDFGFINHRDDGVLYCRYLSQGQGVYNVETLQQGDSPAEERAIPRTKFLAYGRLVGAVYVN